MFLKKRQQVHKFQRRVVGASGSTLRRLKYLAVFFLIVWVVLFLGLGGLWTFERRYQSKIYPEIYLGAYNLSGFQREELTGIINKFKSDLESNGVVFIFKDKPVTVLPQVIATEDPDLTYELFYIDTAATIDQIFKIGRSGNYWQDLKTKFDILRSSYRTELVVEILDEQLKDTLAENFQELAFPARDASLKIDESLEVVIISEEPGIVPNYDLAIRQLKNNLAQLSQKEIVLNSTKDHPRVTGSEFLSKKQDIETIFRNKENLILQFKPEEAATKTWSISKSEYKDWFDIAGERIFFHEGLMVYLEDQIAPDVVIPVQEARFELTESGRVSEFSPSSAGRDIAYQQTLTNINKIFFEDLEVNKPINIMTSVAMPQYTTESINDLGIKEIIGVGKSNFAGSPANRRHNIRIGAEALHGLLIPPGEEFSLIVALGDIDETSQYLPELVIKGNKTIPEYGGGLCQIGTTLFRAILDSGLEVTERRSHSYRVSYYEPVGTDCTIYSPHPDCRFRNDTTHHVLLQTYIKGSEVFFEFWGTDDGRKVTMTDPIISNITKPPPTKYIETVDLEPGEQKCTESAHNGAKAVFDYTVEYADGTKHEESFYSSYKPWQAVCLVGVEDLSTVEEEGEGG